jgi:hypothetical protein
VPNLNRFPKQNLFLMHKKQHKCSSLGSIHFEAKGKIGTIADKLGPHVISFLSLSSLSRWLAMVEDSIIACLNHDSWRVRKGLIGIINMRSMAFKSAAMFLPDSRFIFRSLYFITNKL